MVPAWISRDCSDPTRGRTDHLVELPGAEALVEKAAGIAERPGFDGIDVGDICAEQGHNRPLRDPPLARQSDATG